MTVEEKVIKILNGSIMNNDNLNRRMKENYESRSKQFLTRRTPVIIRLDGKAFHTYTRGLNKPFDEGLIEDMEATTQYLCENIQGVKLGYCQSDEISLLLTDFDDLQTQAWFDYNVQKMTSISASMATAKFNELRLNRLKTPKNFDEVGQFDFSIVKLNKLAFFDSRVFNIPEEEVSNYFLARQKDAVKNSIAMLAQSLYSHKELHKKNGNEMQEMCFQKGYNWNDLDYRKKRGCTIKKELKKFSKEDGTLFVRGKWESVETPMVFNQKYFEDLLKRKNK